MRWPWVSRGEHEATLREFGRVARLFADERARSDKLLEQLLSLRREGFTPQKAGVVIEPPDPEANAKRRAADEWIDNFVDAAVADGKDPREARVVAEAMRAELDAEHVPLEG